MFGLWPIIIGKTKTDSQAQYFHVDNLCIYVPHAIRNTNITICVYSIHSSDFWDLIYSLALWAVRLCLFFGKAKFINSYSASHDN